MDLSIAFIILLLIAITALYVSAEFAAVTVRKSRIQQLADEGNSLAARMISVLDDPALLDRYIAACQIGITVSSLLLGAFGQSHLGNAFSPLFESWGNMQFVAAQSASAAVVLMILTIISMVLGELVPKSLALRFSSQVALFTIIPMLWSLRLFSWSIALLNGSGHLVLKLFGVNGLAHQHVHSAEEINLLIAESRDGGLLEPDEHRRLSQALRLSVQPIREVMVPRERIQALDLNSSLSTVIRVFKEKPFTRLPVYNGTLDRIVGLIHARDVALKTLSDDNDFSLEPLIRPILFAAPTLTTEELIVKMREEGRQMAVVRDVQGRTLGLIGISDILDEFLGDVSEAPRQKPQRLPDNRVVLPASIPLAEAAKWAGVAWQGSTTLGAKIVEALGFLPAPGTRVRVDGVDIEIERGSRRIIESVIVTPQRPGSVRS